MARNATGSAVPGSAIAVSQRVRSAATSQALTDAFDVSDDGTFTLRLAGGPSSTVRFRYPGSEQLKPCGAGNLVLLAPARSTIAADKRASGSERQRSEVPGPLARRARCQTAAS